jgi:methanethiol S-methyltransferase
VDGRSPAWGHYNTAPMRTTAAVASRGARLFAWAGALSFAGSLSFFLFTYAVTFRETTPTREAVTAVAIDVSLFTAFALHHSIFARQRVRASIARLVPAHLERSLYVWISSAMFVGVCAWWQPVAGVAWYARGPVWWGLGTLQVFGLWLSVYSAMLIDVLELSGVRQLEGIRHPVFRTAGPYGWVRHPIYSGWFLMVFAAPTMTMTRLVFAIVSSAYLLIAIPFEERSLSATTNGAYSEYVRHVPWKLVPGIY